jgi:hypothetical protein
MGGPAIVSGPQAPHRIHPGEVALDDPAVLAEPVRRFDAASRDAGNDASLVARVPTFPEIVALVGVELVGSVAGMAAPGALERGDRVEQGVEELTVMDVRRGQDRRERNPFGVDHKMALAPRSALIRRVRADNVAPLFAATVELSRAARLQSISPTQLNSWSSSACNRFHTPRRVHARKRRQHVEPLPQPISKGKSCHGRAVRSTNKIPVSACRFETRGRPPFLPGFRSRGKRGSIRIQSSSVTRGLMPHGRASQRF